jgi:hypothetical protein
MDNHRYVPDVSILGGPPAVFRLHLRSNNGSAPAIKLTGKVK